MGGARAPPFSMRVQYVGNVEWFVVWGVGNGKVVCSLGEQKQKRQNLRGSQDRAKVS